jgi:hypothetical protein
MVREKARLSLSHLGEKGRDEVRHFSSQNAIGFLSLTPNT